MATEKRLIDANALMINLDGCSFETSDDWWTVVEQINEAPTVDAVEVVHGRWIPAGVTEDLAKCSVCGRMNHTLHYVYSIGFKYCPNCGAKMDLPNISDQTKDALLTLGRKAHGETDNGGSQN